VGECVACFAKVFGPWRDNARHTLPELLLIARRTMLTGGKGCSEMAPFEACFIWFMQRFAETLQGVAAVDGKFNERTAAAKLLDLLSLKGRIVIADAGNCQRAIAAKVVAQGCDYVLILRGTRDASTTCGASSTLQAGTQTGTKTACCLLSAAWSAKRFGEAACAHEACRTACTGFSR